MNDCFKMLWFENISGKEPHRRKQKEGYNERNLKIGGSTNIVDEGGKGYVGMYGVKWEDGTYEGKGELGWDGM